MKRIMVEIPVLWKTNGGLDYEKLGIEPPEDDKSYVGPVVIDFNLIEAYNSSTNPNRTTIRLSGDNSYMVDLPYEKFKELYCRVMNIQIEEIV